MNDVIKAKVRKFKGAYKHKRLSFNQFVDKFYRSKFNRDDREDLREGEDINNSSKYRLYSKDDVIELLTMLEKYLEWFLVNEDYDYIYLSKNLVLYRDLDFPRIKKANIYDVNICAKDDVKEGDFYVTHGRYNWMFLTANEIKKSLFDAVERDVRRNIVANDLEIVAKERNKKHEKSTS